MEDEKIIALYWDRDQTAIAETQQKYGRYCGSIAHNIVHDAQDAEECVNDTWMRSAKRILPTYRKRRTYAISEHAGSILCRWLPVWHFF